MFKYLIQLPYFTAWLSCLPFSKNCIIQVNLYINFKNIPKNSNTAFATTAFCEDGLRRFGANVLAMFSFSSLCGQ